MTSETHGESSAPEIATLDIHRGVETRFCMPTIADFRATIERLTSFEDAVSRTVAGEKRTPRVSAAPSQAPGLSLSDVDPAKPYSSAVP